MMNAVTTGFGFRVRGKLRRRGRNGNGLTIVGKSEGKDGKAAAGGRWRANDSTAARIPLSVTQNSNCEHTIPRASLVQYNKGTKMPRKTEATTIKRNGRGRTSAASQFGPDPDTACRVATSLCLPTADRNPQAACQRRSPPYWHPACSRPKTSPSQVRLPYCMPRKFSDCLC